MRARTRVAGLAVCLVGMCHACSGGGSGRLAAGTAAAAVTSATPTGAVGSGTTAAAGSAGPAATPSAAGPVLDFARLEAELDARRRDYLQRCVAGFAGQGEGIYTQLARLEAGVGPLDRAPITEVLDRMDARGDTADFGATALLRLLYRQPASPLWPSDLLQRARTSLLGFKYWIDEPGQDGMCYWSENHQVLFASCELLAGQLYPNDVFTNTGVTGAEHVRRARARLLRWLDERLRFGFSEWYSPVYLSHDVAPVLNLVDFAQDPEIRARAAMVMDLIVFDLARLSHRGAFAVTAGRAYEEYKFSARGHGIGDLIELLFATRGFYTTRGATAAAAFATSSYRVPRALLGVPRDLPDRSIDRARNGLDFADAPAAGIGFTSHEDGIFWWGMGAYLAPETIGLTRDMIQAWDLWQSPFFRMLAPLRWVPASGLSALSQTVAPFSEGSVLSRADTYVFRTPDAMLSSVRDYRPGQVGFQQHAWQATLDLDACVWTTQPGIFGRDGPGPWTGSGSLPRVVQVEDVAVILYNPGELQRRVFPGVTHAFFPRAAFDEVVEQGNWVFARKGAGYVGLYSAQPLWWQTTGPFAGREAVAQGMRNAWVCHVGRAAEDGSFQDFVARLSQARLTAAGAGNGGRTDPLWVDYEAPGLGRLVVGWSTPPTRDGQPLSAGGFPRFDSHWAQVPWGASDYEIRAAGAVLRHDRVAGTRSGDGL